ncbi:MULTISPECIES: sensor histidine kinase [unclassified Bacillus (in: firmicutes)]|uniref:sensor histidine kinase n=1 Tax=unclassified Bacillus (in: firmicutes) TaxID=185979 RepID=UPI0008EF82D2|nr:MULTISPECIES: sensor histidine kinase [unclassified Bacillus (in: firmicutes)]SFB08044.1 two-component system, NarL family, sensor histidine kinase NreB [Bacillus sp. UNCCL13]
MGQSPAHKDVSKYIIQSQEEEIKRIALELHEGVGQNLYSLYNGLQFIESAVEKPEVKSYLKEMVQTMERTIQEIRLLSVELHPPSLPILGLVPALKSYIKLYSSTYGIEVELLSSGKEKPISEHSKISVFRVCQEALANIAKFADTSHVKISLQWDDDSLCLFINDFGSGFDVSLEESYGLAAMKERMRLCSGECNISSKIGEGTSIEVFLPL